MIEKKHIAKNIDVNFINYKIKILQNFLFPI